MVDRVASSNELSGAFDALKRTLGNLDRKGAEPLEACLKEIDIELPDGTRAHVRCHYVRSDGNGRPMVRHLIDQVCNYIVDYSFPRSERRKAHEEYERTGSSHELVRMAYEATTLFTRLARTGEVGELLLYVMAEWYARLPQLLCKMRLKTSAAMHYHGADGVHVGVDRDSGRLALYWGESKIHADAASAIGECFRTLAPYLLETGDGASNSRDLQLVRDSVDLDDPLSEQALKAFLDPRSSKFQQFEHRGLCLIGFDSSAYPIDGSPKELSQFELELRVELGRRLQQIHSKITDENLTTFVIEVFCLPLPSADELRQMFRERMRFDDGAG